MVTDDSLYKALLGEWLFSGCLHPQTLDQDLSYLRNILLTEYSDRFPINILMNLITIKKKSEEFIYNCIKSEKWKNYRIVGFASSFQQNTASLSLAKQLKVKYPKIIIVFGGANCDGEMGNELLQQFPFIDVVFSGESDETFPEFVSNVLDDDSIKILSRSKPVTAVRAVDLNNIESPDFSDFFKQRLKFQSIVKHYQGVPLFESARGCWWGEKHHCTFCGLNGSSMAFRSKTQMKAFNEIDELGKKYGTDILVVDNILDFNYFKEFIPSLSARETKLLLHYESKVNLSLDRLKRLADAGIRKIQPGIETLSTRILKLMDKGCTLIQNVRMLKYATECGIYVEWGFLYGFPEESPEDYKAIAKIIPILRHLQPPCGVTKVRADRFSPYYNSPEKYGVRIKPLDAYAYIYPCSEQSIRKLAYHFELESNELSNVDSYSLEARNEAISWHVNRRKYILHINDIGERVCITDSRQTGEMKKYYLSGIKAEILRNSTDITSIDKLCTILSIAKSEINNHLIDLKNTGLILIEKNKVLSLALRQPGYKRALENYEIRSSLHDCFFH